MQHELMNKKIAYCTPSLYIAGGVERVLTTKANYLADVLGYDVYIILTDGKGKVPYYPLSPKIKVIHLDINFEELWHLSFLKKIPVYLKKQKVFKRELTKVLMNIKPDITVSLLRREINFITSIKDGSKKVGEIHVNKLNYRNFEANETNFIKEKFAKWWMNSLISKLKKLDRFIVLSHEDKGYWHELDNVEVIPNPLPFTPQKACDPNSPKVIAVGRYVYQKGFDLLIDAWKIVNQKHPDWELHIYGNGNKTDYTEQVNRNGIKNCFLENAVNNIEDKYAESSIFVLSSRFEGFGMVLAEAMSCGLSCISFACPCGPKDIINDGVDGILVENNNIEKLAEKICYLIENPEKRKELGRNAARNIKRLNMENIGQKWNALFNDLTQEKNNHA